MDLNFDAFRDVMPDWQRRLDHIVRMMREMSRHEDPEEMVRGYGASMRQLVPADRWISLSRRELQHPWFRVTRDSRRPDGPNPWRDRDRLPLHKGGLLADLLYGNEPRILDDVSVSADDPAAPYVEGMRSLMVIPNYDRGESINMGVLMRAETAAFPVDRLPEHVWLSNLFGRATHNLVLMAELRQAYAAMEKELRVVAEIQRSLLPSRLPAIPNLGLAASYQTSRHAGGDYYDVFPLAGGHWGLLIADVSGHGTPSAVVMAITHALAHSYNGVPMPPGRMLEFVNDSLSNRYTSESGTFVTAFYGIFNPATRSLQYTSAGHNPPRIKRCATGRMASLEEARGLPLGLFEGQTYAEATIDLVPGDQLILYTDGITEATNPGGEQYGVDRLDRAIGHCQETADDLIAAILVDLERFTEGKAAEDDRTLVVGKVS